jgi:hypothetical protein
VLLVVWLGTARYGARWTVDCDRRADPPTGTLKGVETTVWNGEIEFVVVRNLVLEYPSSLVHAAGFRYGQNPVVNWRWWPTVDLPGSPAKHNFAVVGVPLWMPLILFAGLGALSWRLDRSSTDSCAACAYDLSGLRTGAPCPECGKAAQT